MAKKKKISNKGLDKLNPFNKPINKNDTADTGVESVKLAYRSGKRVVTAPKKIFGTIRTIYRTPIRIVRTVTTTVRLVTNAVFTTAAIITSPVFWIIVALILIIYMSGITIMMFIAGISAGTANSKATGLAGGLTEDIVSIFPEAEAFYESASSKKKDEFNEFIDGLYFSVDDLPNSDLVYMVCSHDGSIFDTSMATDYRKAQLKDKFSRSISKSQAIALVYINLEKEENRKNGTDGEIYKVDFSEAAFDDLLDMMVRWTDTVYEGQECPQRNCVHREEENANPRYQEALDRTNTAAAAYNDWQEIKVRLEAHSKIKDGAAQAQYWNNEIAWRINNWNLVYASFVYTFANTANEGADFSNYLGSLYEGYLYEFNNTPVTIKTVIETCDHLHHLHGVGLNVLTKDDVMNAWNFTDIEKDWFELTYSVFQMHPDINADP